MRYPCIAFWLSGALAVLVSTDPIVANDHQQSADCVTRRVDLGSTKAHEVVTLLRILDLRDMNVVDEHNVAICDTPDRLQLVEPFLDMIKRAATDSGEAIPVYPVVADGTVIAVVRLHRASPKEVSTALRRQVQIRRFAMVMEPPLVILRDTKEQIEAALGIVRAMDDGERRD